MARAEALEEVAGRAQRWVAEGRSAAVGRVVEIQGFSTWPGDEVIVAEADGEVAGDVLGPIGRAAVNQGVRRMLATTPPGLGQAVIEIRGVDVTAAGLSCGGRADMLLQPLDQIPPELWHELGRRAPVALISRPAGADSAGALVVGLDGSAWGSLGGPSAADEDEWARKEAEAALAAGHSVTARVEGPAGALILSAWVPNPRLVIVGSGDLVAALDAQAGLLGWQTTATENLDELTAALSWGGASAALVLLSHNPHVDARALQAALDFGAPYIGAMGSRRTQSRRLERLHALGVSDEAIDRIHRPIGLDLGGRSAPEVALAVCAEILAARCGRDARPLKEHTGPIRTRPPRS